MKASQTIPILKQACQRLRNADREAWQIFLDTFDVYATEVTVAVTEAPSDKILNMQGRAQQVLALLRLYREIDIVRSPPQSTPPVNPGV